MHTDTDDSYGIRIEGSTNNAAGVWTGLGIGGESANTKSAVLFEDVGLSYARGKLHLCVNNAQDQTSATPADAKLTVSNDGNVGIGVTSPDNILHIETAASGGPQIQLESTSGTAAAAFINFDSTSLQLSTQRDMVDGTWYDTTKSWGGINIQGPAGGSFITFQTAAASNTSPSTRLTIASSGELQVTGNGVIRNEHSSANFSFWQQTSTDARFFTQYAQPLYFGTNASTRMTILSGGNVGIGTTGPQGKLEVNNRDTATGAAVFIKGGEDDLDPVAGQYTGLAFGYGGGTIYNNAAILWEFTNTAANGKLHFAVNPTAGDGTADLSDSKMTIQDNGNVGIGVTGPQSKLQVDGGIQMGDDTDAGTTAAKAGTMRYRTATDEAVPVTGTELITGNNSDFAGVADGTDVVTLTMWNAYGTVTSRNVESEKLELVTTQANTGAMLQAPTTIGNKYQLTFTASGDLGINGIHVNLIGNANTLTSQPFVFTALAAQTFIYFRAGNNAAGTTLYSNVQLIEVTEEDASYADMCMQTGASTYEWVNIVRNTY